MEISAVIPTRNRTESLYRLLRSLSLQSYPLKEIIIVDSSDTPLELSSLRADFPSFNIIYKNSKPSACIQRNEGIRSATASHLLLCDDDIEVPKDYLTTIAQFLETCPESGAVVGLCFEPDGDGQLRFGLPTTKLKHLLWNFVFQLTVWADLENVSTNTLGRPVLFLLKRFYRYKSNTYSWAGWPLVTQIEKPLFRASLFSLGGSVIRRDWLLSSPFDDILDLHGVGDSYGVTLRFPVEKPIWILTEIHFIHPKSRENRLQKSEHYFRRILALDYFMQHNPRFSKINLLFLLWSLVGNFLYQLSKRQGDMRQATLKAMKLIATGRNPYVLAKNNGNTKCVTPQF